MLAASEKECCGACGTGAAPPIVPGLVTGWGLAVSSKGATAAAWALAMWQVRCRLHLLPIVPGLVTGWGLAASSCSVTAGIGCVPMQNLLLFAELKALDVCPCRIYYFWQN